MTEKLDAESYLQSGSNEVRILEFQCGGMTFGINILKVSKIVNDLQHFIKVPEAPAGVDGMFRDMDRLVPVVDLAGLLSIDGGSKTNRQKVIITEFFGVQTGFLVDSIDWIHHFGWEDVVDPTHVFGGIDQRLVIGIVRPNDDRMVLMLDYETILLDLCPHIRNADIRLDTTVPRPGLDGRSVLVAEDSPAVRAMLINEFTAQGANVQVSSDGQAAWELFQSQPFDLVICDVEMPRMDGLAVTLRIRQHPERSETPVIVYSSIGDAGMKSRAKFLKADAHITKLNLNELMMTAERLIHGEGPILQPATDEPERESPQVVVPLD